MDTFPEGTVLYTDDETMLAITPRDDAQMGGTIEHAFISTDGRRFQELVLAEYAGSPAAGDHVIFTDVRTDTDIPCEFFPNQLIRFGDRELVRKPWPQDPSKVEVTFVPDPSDLS